MLALGVWMLALITLILLQVQVTAALLPFTSPLTLLLLLLLLLIMIIIMLYVLVLLVLHVLGMELLLAWLLLLQVCLWLLRMRGT
jgi:hypothetical protein